MRIVAISDTHNMHERVEVPDGDVLVHAGDFTGIGMIAKAQEFLVWLEAQPHARKVLICGNHEVRLENSVSLLRQMCLQAGVDFLHRDTTTIDGVKFYGDPRTPRFMNWGFMYNRGDRSVWQHLPDDADVWVTHGPPHGAGDECPDLYDDSLLVNVGCKMLRQRIEELQPKIVICGHIHEGYGQYQIGETRVYNASICTGDYKPTNPPVIIDL